MAEIIIALDYPRLDAALSLVDRVGDAVSFYKVGPVLYTRTGPTVLRELRGRGKRIFLDLKLHDIPNTVAHAVEAVAELEVDLLTLHASGGTAMMRAAAEAAGPQGPRLLGVTLLTSFTPGDVEEVWGKQLLSVRDETLRLVALAGEAGLHGIVTSALEAEAVKRRQGADFLVVTPGIRPSGDLADDQARTATPAEAVRAGADYLVIGRPVTGAPEPADVVARIRAEMDSALEAAG
ncbi:MAG TPA: orotidine-5'-phosphate decarboxylase [Longimicrobiales bacterium]|nr:orotidine-5'-phosphate decarboxylase [Longimicrobiales bacterium]